MMNVYLNHIDPGRFHTVYQELADNGPVIYVNYPKAATRENKGKGTRPLLFNMGKTIVNTLYLPTFNFVKGDFDLIHSCQSLPLSKSPYVIDFEHASALGGWNLKRINSIQFKTILRHALKSKRCKKILPWTHASAKSLFSLLEDMKIEEKTEVVYPAISFPKKIQRRNKGKNKKFTFLFVAYNFYRKGGEEAVRAFEMLDIDARLVIVCNPEPGFSKIKNKKIVFAGLKTKKELYEDIFPQADAFIYPTYHDTFGMVYLEAMSFGLPVITLDDFPTSEIIKDGVNGFVIKGYSKKWFLDNCLTREGATDWKTAMAWRTEEEKEKASKSMAEKMLILVKDAGIRENIRKNNIAIIKDGKFSIKYRNKQLMRIYKG